MPPTLEIIYQRPKEIANIISLQTILINQVDMCEQWFSTDMFRERTKLLQIIYFLVPLLYINILPY